MWGGGKKYLKFQTVTIDLFVIAFKRIRTFSIYSFKDVCIMLCITRGGDASQQMFYRADFSIRSLFILQIYPLLVKKGGVHTEKMLKILPKYFFADQCYFSQKKCAAVMYQLYLDTLLEGKLSIFKFNNISYIQYIYTYIILLSCKYIYIISL